MRLQEVVDESGCTRRLVSSSKGAFQGSTLKQRWARITNSAAQAGSFRCTPSLQAVCLQERGRRKEDAAQVYSHRGRDGMAYFNVRLDGRFGQ